MFTESLFQREYSPYRTRGVWWVDEYVYDRIKLSSQLISNGPRRTVTMCLEKTNRLLFFFCFIYFSFFWKSSNYEVNVNGDRVSKNLSYSILKINFEGWPYFYDFGWILHYYVIMENKVYVTSTNFLCFVKLLNFFFVIKSGQENTHWNLYILLVTTLRLYLEYGHKR